MENRFIEMEKVREQPCEIVHQQSQELTNQIELPQSVKIDDENQQNLREAIVNDDAAGAMLHESRQIAHVVVNRPHAYNGLCIRY